MTPAIVTCRSAPGGIVWDYGDVKAFEEFLKAKPGRIAEWVRCVRAHADALEREYADLLRTDTEALTPPK